MNPPAHSHRMLRRVAALTLAAVTIAACGSDDGGDETDDADAATDDGAATGTATDDGDTSTGTEADAGDAPRGGTALVAMTQEPGLMNPLFNVEGGTDLALGAVLEPLMVPRADGTYEPVLVEEVPTVENGLVSEDGLEVTLPLREDITWSDGEPFTADDLVFTFDVIRDEGSATVATPAFDPVESVTAEDDHTVVVSMSDVNPQYQDLFEVVLPEHRFDDTAVGGDHELARLPLGTGPFVFADWQAGDHLSLEANPDYWRDPELPLLDGITFQMTPDRDAAIASFVNGDYDSIWFLQSGDLPVIADAIDSGAPLVLDEVPLDLPEWLWLNHSDGGDLDTPHPVLGDPSVREAIDHAIDRGAIIDSVLGGFGSEIGSIMYRSWAEHPIEPTPFDPDEARRILDEAGWVESDGVREKDGVRAEIQLSTISGSQTRELYQQIIQENLQDVGIGVTIENFQSAPIFGSFADGGMLATGDFDTMISLDGFRTVDPSWFLRVFTTGSIPSDDNPSGFTYSHWSNEEFDQLVADAASTLDEDERADLYAQAAEIFHDDRVALPLYASTAGYVYNERLGGVDTSYWMGMWQNPSVAEWHLTG